MDLVDLFNSAEIYKNPRRNKETKGAAFGCAPQGRRAPLWLVSLILLAFLYISAELNKLTKSTKSQLPPSQLPPFTSPQAALRVATQSPCTRIRLELEKQQVANIQHSNNNDNERAIVDC